MTLETVPWMVAGGAQHSAEVGRSVAYASIGGLQGVVKKGDLQVQAQSTPGGSVRIADGVGAVANSYAGQSGQSYVARNVGYENISVPPTSGSSRSDMIVLRIDDPEFGGSVPASVATGPYCRFAIISNVGSAATDIPAGTPYPAIPLARIDIPSGTGTITSAMIKDLRKIAGKTKTIFNLPLIDKDFGANDPGDAQLIHQYGRVSGHTEASFGIYTLNFPTPFPNALIHLDVMTLGGAPNNPVINGPTAINKNGCNLIWPASKNVDIVFSYHAVGW